MHACTHTAYVLRTLLHPLPTVPSRTAVFSGRGQQKWNRRRWRCGGGKKRAFWGRGQEGTVHAQDLPLSQVSLLRLVLAYWQCNDVVWSVFLYSSHSLPRTHTHLFHGSVLCYCSDWNKTLVHSLWSCDGRAQSCDSYDGMYLGMFLQSSSFSCCATQEGGE